METDERIAWSERHTEVAKQNQRLRIRIARLESANSSLRQEFSAEKIRHRRTQKQLEEAKEREVKARSLCASLEERIKELQAMLDSAARNTLSCPRTSEMTTCECIFNDLLQNKTRDKKHRVYSKQSILWSFTLWSISPSCYTAVRSLLPMPSETTIRERMMGHVKEVITSLSDVTKAHPILQKMRKPGDNTEVICAIGVDAASIGCLDGEGHLRAMLMKSSEQDVAKINRAFAKLFQETIPNEGLGEALVSDRVEQGPQPRPITDFFVYMLLPLSSEYRPTTIHVELSPSGRLGEEQITKLHYFHALLQNFRFKVKFYAVDGDTGFNYVHRQVFSRWFSVCPTLDATLNHVEQSAFWPVLDLLHAVKCARARIINHVVAIYPQTAADLVSAMSLNEDLELGLALADESQIGKMKDAYALQIFTCVNSFTELEKGKFASFYFLLIYMLLIDVFRCPHFSLELRIFLTRLVYYLFRLECDACRAMPQRGKKGSTVGFAERVFLEKVLNTIVGFHYSLKKVGAGFLTHRFGTHVIENRIGNYRMRTRGVKLVERVHRDFAVTEVSHEVHDVLKISSPVRRRDNVGGTRIAEDGVHLNLDMEPAEVARILRSIAQTTTPETWSADQRHKNKDVLCWLCETYSEVLGHYKQQGIPTPTLLSGQQILGRLLARSVEKLDAEEMPSEPIE